MQAKSADAACARARAAQAGEATFAGRGAGNLGGGLRVRTGCPILVAVGVILRIAGAARVTFARRALPRTPALVVTLAAKTAPIGSRNLTTPSSAYRQRPWEPVQVSRDPGPRAPAPPRSWRAEPRARITSHRSNAAKVFEFGLKFMGRPACMITANSSRMMLARSKSFPHKGNKL